MDRTQQRLAGFKKEFFPYIKQLSKDELSTFFGFVEWFIDQYCTGYQLEGPIYLVLDNSIVQDFKDRQQKKRWLRAQSYVALTRFIAIFSDRETCLCVSPVAVYEHAGKVVPATAEAANALVSEIFELLTPCRLPIATIGFKPNSDSISVLADVHHDAEFMCTFAKQIDEMDLQRDLRAPGGGVRFPIAIAADLIPDDMPLRYFEPWYVKYVFTSRIEHKIAAQSKQHPDAQPILSGKLGSSLAELNELKPGVLKGIGDIDLLQICDIRHQYAVRPGHVLLGQTLDRTLANVLRQRHCFIESRQIVGGSKDTERQVAAVVKMMSSNPFAEQDERAKRIAPDARNFLKNLHDMCRATLQLRRD
jgi:hypothetical protein